MPQSGLMVFNPESTAVEVLSTVSSYKDYEQRIREMGLKLVEKRKALGAAKPYLIPIVSRQNANDFRYLDLYNIDKDRKQKKNPDTHLNDLDVLASNFWRVLSVEEEKVAAAAQARERLNAIDKSAEKQILKASAQIYDTLVEGAQHRQKVPVPEVAEDDVLAAGAAAGATPATSNTPPSNVAKKVKG
ncbi:MAG TPA: hypothetical protein VGP72_16545 [Planctomycetota bacterium]|jgi:hypothetical protein